MVWRRGIIGGVGRLRSEANSWEPGGRVVGLVVDLILALILRFLDIFGISGFQLCLFIFT